MTALARYHLLDRIAELEAEVDWLRSQLGIQETIAPALRRALHIQPRSAQVLAMIYAGAGKWVRRDTIEGALDIQPKQDKVHNAVTVHICNLRKAIGRDGIETDGSCRDAVARLSRAGMERVVAALSALEPSQPR
jgi:DNA-binding response OmpR family regulator